MRIKSIALFGLCLGLVSSNVFSGVNNVLSDGMSHCVKVASDSKRLACFDQLGQDNLVKLNSNKLHNQSLMQKAPIQSPEKQKIDDFSKEDLIKTEEERGLESITATITSLKQLMRGQWVVDLENGQQWQQQGSAKIKLKEGDIVLLKKGALGVVYLSKQNSSRSIRVKRLK